MNIREKIILKLLPELKIGVKVNSFMLDDIVKAADYLISKMENKPEFSSWQVSSRGPDPIERGESLYSSTCEHEWSTLGECHKCGVKR